VPDLSDRTETDFSVFGRVDREAGTALAEGPAELAAWWSLLGSERLDALVERLLAENLTLEQARQRVLASRARYGATASARLPSADGSATYARAGTRNDGINFAGPPPGREVDVWSVATSAAWELDLWGRVARLVEGAEADIDIAVEDLHAAGVALVSELVLAYVDATTFAERERTARRDVEVRRDTLRSIELYAAAGRGTRLEVEGARQALARAEARVPELVRARRQAENRIAVLVGDRPTDGLVDGDETLTLPPSIGLGLPADLLSRRSDVRRAERALARAVAGIGVAEAERLPRITIGGTLALRALQFGTFANGLDTLSYQLGPNLSVPLFTGGRLKSIVELREIEAEQAALAFEQSLLQAIEEVETAAEGVVRTRERLARLGGAVEAAERTVVLTEQLEDAGRAAATAVWDAEAARVALEDERLEARRSALVQTVSLYRALGGGWEHVEWMPSEVSDAEGDAATEPSTGRDATVRSAKDGGN
jgi:multidrug efflux system outer membrane protein